MTPWINTLPPAMASAVAESSLFDLLSPFRAIFTITFGTAPELPSDAVSLDDMDHLNPTSSRSVFFCDLLHRLDSTTPVNQVFFFLSTTSIACTWSHSCTRDKPALATTLLQFLVDIQSDITLLRSCATLLSQVLGGASPAAIWESVFAVLNLRLAAAQPAPPSPVRRTSSAAISSSDPPRASTPINILSSVPAATVKTRQTPIKPNSGTSVYQTGTHQEVDPRIRDELRGLTFPDTPGFMDAFFSRHQSPAADVLSKLADSRSGDSWTDFPHPPRPLAVEAWYLALANRVLSTTGMNRRYIASPTRALTGHDSIRKPDLILLDSPIGADIDWSDVLVVGELKQGQEKGLEVDTIVQLAGYIRIIFAKQHNRRFVHGFTICGDFMRCWVFHRGGAMGGDAFNLNSDPSLFLTAVLGYAAMSNAELGFDPTLAAAQEGILIGGLTRMITLAPEPFFAPAAIAARGTTCWDATLAGDSVPLYVLKDSWRSIHHSSEGALLTKARELGVVGIVEFIAYEDVQFDGRLDDLFDNVMMGLQVGKAINMRALEGQFGSRSDAAEDTLALTPTTIWQQRFGTWTATKRPRDLITDDQPLASSSYKRVKTSSVYSSTFQYRAANRIHTRILTTKGRNITTFTSAHELLLAFSGAIRGHRSLYQNGILHRDISINNIMITSAGTARPDGLTGFLIDLDLAVETAATVPSGAPHRTGTMEFMAIGALNREVHTFHHDLESFFYVFLWVCINYRLGRAGASQHVWPRKTTLDHWGGSFGGSALAKWGDMGRTAVGSQQGLERILVFEAWAVELKPLARAWRDVLFPLAGEGVRTFSIGEGDYEKILGLLEEWAQRVEKE